VQAWRDWVEKQGAEVHWAHVREAPAGFHNRILVSVGNGARSELLEIDLEGTVIWSKRLDGTIQGVKGLPNGHRLVSFWSRRVVVEYDRRGNEVWRSPRFDGSPGCAQRLSDGTTLVCFPLNGLIREITTGGETVRTLRPGNGFYFAERLESGITRVGHYQQRKIIDLDRHGRIVRQRQLSGNPFMVRKLENGNMLVCMYSTGAVEEHGPQGKVVRTVGQFTSPTSAYRIANGITLVGDRGGVWSVDEAGRRRQILRKTGKVWISYY